MVQDFSPKQPCLPLFIRVGPHPFIDGSRRHVVLGSGRNHDVAPPFVAELHFVDWRRFVVVVHLGSDHPHDSKKWLVHLPDLIAHVRDPWNIVDDARCVQSVTFVLLAEEDVYVAAELLDVQRIATQVHAHLV